MDRMTKFKQDLRILLMEKIKNKKLDLSQEKVSKIRLAFQEVNGEQRYYIDEDIVDKIPDDIVNEIEALWTSGQ